MKAGKELKLAVLLTWKPLIRICVISVVLITLFIVLSLNGRSPSNHTVRPAAGRVRNGPGELGFGVNTLPNETRLVQEAYRLYGFNQHVSDKISVERSIRELRDPACLVRPYSAQPLKVSVIIVFYEEGWSTLIRTVMSVINRSPTGLLHQVVLVDDHSLMNHLKDQLDNFVRSWRGLVKLVRSAQHEGLIRARIRGADAATGDVFVFLDSHCECSDGWLPPLIDPIRENYRAVTCPTIDFIRHNTFAYEPYGETARGTISWLFHYKERPLSPEQIANRSSPVDLVESPVMAGGLFAIHRKWWEELGKYDPEYYVWGGEQYELSFKLWMCGGVMYNVPCSRVGHVYRGPGMVRNDQGISAEHPRAVDVNYRRVAEVWMDEYKHFLFERRPNLLNLPPGFDVGLEERRKLRENLKCHDFKWYLENVVKDTLRTAYEPDRAWAKITNSQSDLCLDVGDQLKMSGCTYSKKFRWTWINEIRVEEHCLDTRSGIKVSWDWCHESGGAQRLVFNEDTQAIYSSLHRKCMSYNDNHEIVLENCNSTNKRQKWTTTFNDLTITAPWAKFAIHPPRTP